MSSAVTTVLFDLDETLCDYVRSSAELLDAAFEAAGVDPLFDVARYHEIAERYRDDAEAKAERRARCFADLAERAGRDRSIGRDVASVYADLRDHGNVSAYEGVGETLTDLGETHALGVVTNGEPAMQDPKLDAIDIRERFDTVVYAGIDTPAKPATAPFERALADLDATPAEAVFVGNSIETDITGANRAGLTSVWIPLDRDAGASPETDRERPDHRVDDVTALRERPWE
ncbi:HAD family hydrolase [Halosimplex salinum]|uniref:HAD family hydrolase n=1 Tax=Halosimplex salinum TaxID=1710538 RepID=UPI000F488102|nr:HAD family hydrolase [Halosimplex salinum]